MKIIILIITGIILVTSIIGITMFSQNSETGNYQYEIQGNAGGAGPHTKTDLLLTRIDKDKPSNIHTVDLTKDLHYTDLILFSDWNIYHLENTVIVTWITSEQSWSDVFVAYSDDYGKTFQVKNISQSRPYDHEHQVQIVGKNVYLAWTEESKTLENVIINHIYFAKSTDLGKSFSEPLILSSQDKSSYEFDLTVNDKLALVVWREDVPSDPNDDSVKNIFFAQIFDRQTDNILTFSGLIGGHFDFELDGDTLHGVWSSTDDNDRLTYGYSKDYGITFSDVREIFDADWYTNPYAPSPIPKITIGDEITIEWRMYNEKGEDTPYKTIIVD